MGGRLGDIFRVLVGVAVYISGWETRVVGKLGVLRVRRLVVVPREVDVVS